VAVLATWPVTVYVSVLPADMLTVSLMLFPVPLVVLPVTVPLALVLE
jgi:hypothetical protein